MDGVWVLLHICKFWTEGRRMTLDIKAFYLAVEEEVAWMEVKRSWGLKVICDWITGGIFVNASRMGLVGALMHRVDA